METLYRQSASIRAGASGHADAARWRIGVSPHADTVCGDARAETCAATRPDAARRRIGVRASVPARRRTAVGGGSAAHASASVRSLAPPESKTAEIQALKSKA